MREKNLKIMCVVGARPNFMKIAPIVRAIRKTKGMSPVLVHTGQHYDRKMSKLFFEDLKIPKPDIYLGVGSDTHAVQTAKIMVLFEKILNKHKPGLVLVVGDVNSTLACSVTASKLNIPVAHVEAGLRSNDRNMPEEINRLVTDSISDLLFTTSKNANVNLKREGVSKEKIKFVGNVMIDTLLFNKKKAEKSNILKKLKIKKKSYGLVTLHRPSNVDSKTSLKNLLDVFTKVQNDIDIVFPVHPRTVKRLEQFGLKKKFDGLKNLKLIEPLGYLDFLNLMMHCKLVLTDSGGIQEETTILNIPCLTLRENTERPITITHGTNYLVGMNKVAILKNFKKVLQNKGKKKKHIAYWDGQTAQRITRILSQKSVRTYLNKRAQG